LFVDDNGRLGQANTPKATLPSSSRANAMANWSPPQETDSDHKMKIQRKE
jgi:hypothetical protein